MASLCPRLVLFFLTWVAQYFRTQPRQCLGSTPILLAVYSSDDFIWGSQRFPSQRRFITDLYHGYLSSVYAPLVGDRVVLGYSRYWCEGIIGLGWAAIEQVVCSDHAMAVINSLGNPYPTLG